MEGKMDVEKGIFEKIIECERERLSTMAAENRKIRGGNIKKRKKGNKYYYTEYVKGKEYGITNDLERIRLLYRKKYLKSSIRRSKTLIKHLNKLLEELDKIPFDEDCMYQGKYCTEAWNWMKAEYDTNPAYQENLRYVTTLGTRVRSKSELNIANTLERLGVPSRYEQKMCVNGTTVYPDFTILLPSGDILIWEHNGLMDNIDYMEKARSKTYDYEREGFRQHNNLIITYEDDIRSPEKIEEIIRRFYYL
ncbi:MAG: hypothetical protein IKU39_03150 [Lachnospiraceae bacterium]|nr:hypothetical protein [Lachnospiraceae bacterium]